ncbi:hypothetical protein TELCIR_08484 [Teladorsagia circumcincta]|uniref:Ras family protein n=1 Tax=Teladorsagia circumcincta TaxID=45464 RepID=A0A2G9UHM9_TELCI|nr:hypothetical protein TELCIR_08484 [Teladorsagia circumcincta]
MPGWRNPEYDLRTLHVVHAYCEAPDIIICGNKADLENRRQVSTARAKQLADQLGTAGLVQANSPVMWFAMFISWGGIFLFASFPVGNYHPLGSSHRGNSSL